MIVNVQLIGDADRAEMRPIMAWLQDRTTVETLHRNATVSDFLAQRHAEWQPDLIAALESHPDEFSSDDVTALFAAAPICRIVCCAGAWSEAAGRTRKIWPLAVRVPAVSALHRLESEWQVLLNQSTESPLPPTGSREERFAAHHPAICASTALTGKTIGVFSPDPAYRDLLCDLLSAAGGTVVTDQTDAADLVIWDVDPWSAERAEEFPRCGASVIAVSGWITPELESSLTVHDICAVLPKLGDHQRLLEYMAALMSAE